MPPAPRPHHAQLPPLQYQPMDHYQPMEPQPEYLPAPFLHPPVQQQVPPQQYFPQPFHHPQTNPHPMQQQPFLPLPMAPLAFAFRPQSPGIDYLNKLNDHPQALSAMDPNPIGMRRVTDKQREAISQFVSRELAEDPTGINAYLGEFGQGFRTGVDPQGHPAVEPNHPIRYGIGGALTFQPGDKTAPTSFTDIHSHPPSMNHSGINNMPSIVDQRAVRLMRQINPEYKYALLQGGDLKYYSYNGKLPLRHYELIDLGPGYTTPPRATSPDIVPPLPPDNP